MNFAAVSQAAGSERPSSASAACHSLSDSSKMARLTFAWSPPASGTASQADLERRVRVGERVAQAAQRRVHQRLHQLRLLLIVLSLVMMPLEGRSMKSDTGITVTSSPASRSCTGPLTM